MKLEEDEFISSLRFCFYEKVLFESKSLINGRWPAITCQKDATDGFWSRLPYTWYGLTYGSIFFYLIFLWIYEVSSFYV